MKKLGEPKHQDFEINIASIIDCFTVLITYLLVSASFITLGMFSVTVASVSTESAPVTADLNPDVKLNLMLKLDQSMNLQVEGNSTENFNIPMTSGHRDLEELKTQLDTMVSRYTKLNSKIEGIQISAEDAVGYKDIVSVVDAVQKGLSGIPVALSAEGL